MDAKAILAVALLATLCVNGSHGNYFMEKVKVFSILVQINRHLLVLIS